MADSESNNEISKAILYDINTCAKWMSEKNLSKDQFVFQKYQKNKKSYNYLLKFGSWLKNRWFTTNNENMLKFLFTSTKPWNETKLAVSDSGSIAVLQENSIEFYENLNELIWRVEISTEFVGICNIFFNQHKDLLIYTNEHGSINIFDLRDGSQILEYNENISIDFENSICKIFFIERDQVNLRLPNSDEIIDIMFSITYYGYLNVYAIYSDKTILKIYSQSLLNVVKNGIYCADIDSSNQYLILGSFVSNSYSNNKQSVNGLYMWRILNCEPWLKHVEVNNDLDNLSLKYKDKYSKNSTKMNFSKIEYVTKLQISFDNTSVVAIYVSGKIAIYALPSLKLINEWFMTEQPCFNEMNNEILENPSELKLFKQIYKDPDYRVVDIGWWNKQVLILTRGTGLLSLVSSIDLSNLMGQNQQWMTPYASLYSYQKNQFIILNCYCTFANQTLNDDLDDMQTNNSTMDEMSDNQDNDEDEDDGWFYYAKETLRSQAYNLIGLERLAPKPKKPKILKRKYSILHIKSTSPEELFERKLNLEEYGEALQLAKSYNLDTDLVYQKQWRLKPITKSTVIDYLSKIKKRSWVLHECEERISPNIDTTKYLLDFGLQGTDLDVLIAIKDKDDNKFIYSKAQIRKANNYDSDSDSDDDEIGVKADKFNPEYIKRQKRKLEEAQQQKIKKIDFSNLTLMQKELMATRTRLLKYMDRLILYEQILGGPRKAAELFDPEKYAQIRSKPILEVAFDFARESNAYAIEIILSYFHQELNSKQLEIFENFPEFLDPDKYVRLLPRFENGSVVIFNEPDTLRDYKDWIELPDFQSLINPNFTDDNQHQNPNQSYDIETVQNWYFKRTMEIEKYSGLVEVALNFAEIAIGNEFSKNMSSLVENLRTLYTLIYECQKNKDTETFYTLEFVTELKDIEKLQLIMSHSFDVSSDMFIKNLQDWLLPFVMRRPTINLREKLIREYLIKESKENLNACSKLLSLKLKYLANPSLTSNSIQYSHMLQEVNLISIIIDCLYENDKPEQIDLCKLIINDIVHGNEKLAKSTNEKATQNQNLSSSKLQLTHQQHQKVKLAQDHLKACELFRKYGLNKTLSYVNNSCLNEENCRNALIKLTWFASKKTSHLKMNEWIDLMKDLQNLQTNLYKNLISYQDCTEIFLTSLIGSRNLDNINMAADWLRDIYIVDKEAAIMLGIKSAQEYFNSSSNYHDPDMNFARECLNLVKSLISSKPSEEILHELANNDPVVQKCLNLIKFEEDLIMSVKLIAEFDYAILPVQVRSSEHPIEIIKDILKKNENSYKDYDKFIQLANYLNHNPKMNEQADVILLIAEYSLNKHNLFVLSQMCKHLVRLNYSPAWSCVHKLSFHLCENLADHFKIPYDDENQIYEALYRHEFDFRSSYGSKEKTILNLSDIENLLSFSLTHCDSSKIEEILNQKLLIEKARLRLEQIDCDDSLDEEEEEDDTLSFNKLSFDYFNTINDFDLFQAKQNRVKFFLRILLKQRQNINNKNVKEIIKYLNKLFKIDANLTLGYMLELNDLDLDYFKDLYQFDSNSSTSYEFLLYLFGLNLLNRFNNDNLNEKSYLYLLKPSSLNSILNNMDYDESLDIIQHENSTKYSLNNYKNVNKLYTEYNQNKSLKELNAGIDLNRFESDKSYKHDTIMGLSLDIKTFDLACSLARFYSFDIWKVYMSFTEYLLTETVDLDLIEIDKKIQPLLSILKSKPDQFKTTMFDNVFSLINGQDLDKLIIFYGLLEGVDPEAIIHVKIIKKLKSLALSLFDYKNLIDKPIETIESYLDESNLDFYAKLLPKLPIKNKNLKLNSSKIHVIWCLKKIWPEKEEEEENAQIEEQTFLDNIENLSDSIKKLDIETDFIYFVKELNLNKKSVYRLNTHIRKEVNKKMLRILKQLQSSNIEKLIKELNKISTHIKLIESVEKLGIDKKYSKLLDLNLGSILIENDIETGEDELKKIKIEKLDDVLIDMILGGVNCELLNDIINLFDLKDVLNIKSLVRSCLNKISINLKKKNRDNQEELVKVKILLESLSNYFNKNEVIDPPQETLNKKKKKNQVQEQTKQRLISEEDVMECIRSFCNDQEIDLNTRLHILEDIKDSFKTIRDEDLMILLIYKTNAILANVACFENRCDLVDSIMIQNESQRLNLINKYLDLSVSEEHCLALVKILKIWPEFSNIQDLSQKPSINILIKLVKNNYSFIEWADQLINSGNLSQDDLFYLKSQLEEDSNWNIQLKLAFLKLLFLFKNSKLVKEFLNQSIDLTIMDHLTTDLDNLIVESNENLSAIINDKILMNLLLNEKFYLDIINTRFYSLFEWYLINNENRQNISKVVRQLKAASHTEEAARLLLKSESFYDCYKTLSVSLNMLDKFE